ncbi:hypothetical protein [Mycobacterium sp. 1245852.3]|uniref:hypothetical protein n=1 Tax=Mycobacterium sp. 1245852.3 TaxID=1856860 RepID=UPI0007FBF724|nr:hypothetical protein [Mycobacterium sp. 1245852.3]OBJ86975.1 hypothetical protein A9W96_02370 [Mycobacterium sp. 1245852.3]
MSEHQYDYSTADVIKNVYARVAEIQPALVADGVPNLAWAAEKTTALLADLAAHLNTIGSDVGRYDDGRAVVSIVPLDDDGHFLAHVWDPRPDHPTNSPHVVSAGIPFAGMLVDLVVSGRGVIDVVRRPAADVS